MNGSSLDTPMRIRTVKPEFWTHPVMARQSDATQLIAIGLLNYSDDHGYFYADAALVRSAVKPFHDTSYVQQCMDDLVKIGFIEIREHPTHGKIGKVLSFHKHQKVDKPYKSKISYLFNGEEVPSFDDCSRKNVEGTGNREQVEEQVSGNGTGIFDTMREEASSKTKGTFDEVLAFCKEQGLKDIDAEYCFNNWEGNGWTRAGKKIKDWKAVIRTWKSQGFLPSQKQPAVSTSPKGQIPAWKQIQAIKSQLETHPANPEWIGYVREKVTPEQREHYQNQKANLKRLEAMV